MGLRPMLVETAPSAQELVSLAVFFIVCCFYFNGLGGTDLQLSQVYFYGMEVIRLKGVV
jgi:hypothetical protein